MPFATIDGIATRYETIGSGPPLLMYAPGGFNATIEAWSTLGIYAKIKPLDHLSQKYTCIVFDRRECGQSGGRVEALTWGHYVAQGKGLLDHLGWGVFLTGQEVSDAHGGQPSVRSRGGRTAYPYFLPPNMRRMAQNSSRAARATPSSRTACTWDQSTSAARSSVAATDAWYRPGPAPS